MKSISLFLACALAAGALGADQPANGTVLVLDNDRTLEGDITREGDQYLVKRAVGTTTIPADRVLKLCTNRKEALAFLRERAAKDDPDERLRLARWCHLQGMRQDALDEVEEALRLRPDHAETLRLKKYLEQWAKYDKEPRKPTAAVDAPKPSAPPVSITADTMGQFVSRVQPILMNACARCHSSSDNQSAFKLERSHGIGMANRRALQENLAAVLAQLQLGQPERSPLLIKSISAHGPTTEAPLKGRQAPAFRTLEDWVRLTLASNPHLQDVLRPAAAVEPRPSKPVEKEGSVDFGSQRQPTATDAAPSPKPQVTPPRDTKPDVEPARTVPVLPGPKPTAVDNAEPESEFDAVIFNRLAHPSGKPAVPKK